MFKRITATVLMLVFGVGIYFIYFRHPPAGDILAANRVSLRKAPSQYENMDINQLTPSQLSKLRWDRFIESNNYVSIGEIFNKCGELNTNMF